MRKIVRNQENPEKRKEFRRNLPVEAGLGVGSIP